MYPLAGYVDTLKSTNPKDCPYCFPNDLCVFHRGEEMSRSPEATIRKSEEEKVMAQGSSLSYSNEGWVLVERYVKSYPDDFRLVFKKRKWNGEQWEDLDDVQNIDVRVDEEVWRAFDSNRISVSYEGKEKNPLPMTPTKSLVSYRDYGDEGCGEKGDDYGGQTS